MAWQAKPKGGYSVNSDAWKSNIDETYSLLSSGWTLEAIAGMGGNIQSESGWNPWRWQSDSVSLTDKYKGYGLPQFTPAYGYINNYGKGIDGYSPNLSVSYVTTGATPEDGKAQIICIDEDRAGKFINRSRYCTYADISGLYPLANFKQADDLWLATVAWLYHYEFPAAQYRTYSAAQARYQNSLAVFDYINNQSPEPEPEPPDPPGPQPQPYSYRHMPLYLYGTIKRRKIKWQ